jgi:hypothetical protein
MLEQLQVLIRSKAVFWREKPDDAHGINTAVYVALSDIASSMENLLRVRAMARGEFNP